MPSLTPLQLIAGAALGNNTGIAVSSELTGAIDAYRSTSLISPFANTLANVQAPSILGNAYANLLTLTATNCPALSDSTPSAYAGQLGILLSNSAAAGNSASGFTSLIPDFGNIYIGNGDDSIFVQIFISATGYIFTTNDYILTANNSGTYLGSNFTTMNSLITGNLDEVSLAFGAIGNDLKNLGLAINLATLDNLGSPLNLLQQILVIAGLTPRLATEIELLGLDIDTITDPPATLSQLLTLNKVFYTIFTEITGQDLAQILNVMAVTTPNINSLADLLNPVKMFPQSFLSLTMRTVDGLRGIYLNQSGSVNVSLISSLPEYVLTNYQQIAQMIPADQALANQCLRVSLQQIKNIFNLELPALANSYLNLVTTKDLNLINQLTVPVPQSAVDFYITNYATGSGPEGTLVISDLIGAAAGIGYTDKIANAVEVFNSVAGDANFSNLVITYQRMSTTISGGYGNATVGPVVIPAGPGAGTYNSTTDGMGNIITTAAYEAFDTGLIPNAQSFITTFISTNPAAANTLATNWTSMAEKLINESNNLATASIVIPDLIPNQRSAILGFVQNLPTYGLDTIQGGAAEFLDHVADMTTIGGQAIIGALRQGRNVGVLDTAGVGNDIEIPSTYQQPPPQANIAVAEYSEADAANLVIR
jgi:hypothetical protein